MSVDPHGHPWPDTPPMTTPPDDPRADEGLVEAMARAMCDVVYSRDPLEARLKVCDGCWRDWEEEARAAITTYRALAAARSHGGM